MGPTYFDNELKLMRFLIDLNIFLHFSSEYFDFFQKALRILICDDYLKKKKKQFVTPVFFVGKLVLTQFFWVNQNFHF